jgi:glutathione S-transferase
MATTPREPIVLHGFTLSGHCHRVELFARLLGLPLQVLQVDLAGGAQRKPEFLALNRFAQVPVINDNGTVVADSNAILTYLALRYAPEHWLPREPLAAARMQRWLSVAAGPLARSAAAARAVKVFRRDVDTTAAVTEAQQLFTRIDAEIQASGEPWLAGTEPSIADLALYTYTAHAPEGGIALEPYPAIRAWLARVEALPGFFGMPVSPVGLRAAP